jgi:phosphoenolpyruvate carboxylase
MREITSLWQTDELRRHKPTPVDGEVHLLHCAKQPYLMQGMSDFRDDYTKEALYTICDCA